MQISRIASIILCLAGALHILRAVMGWELTISTRSFPIWLSYVAGILALGIGISLWRSDHH